MMFKRNCTTKPLYFISIISHVLNMQSLEKWKTKRDQLEHRDIESIKVWSRSDLQIKFGSLQRAKEEEVILNAETV